MIKEFLENKIKQGPAVLPNEQYFLPPAEFSEFASGGKLDYARITTKYEIYCSFADFLDAVDEVFGTRKFTTDKTAPSEITKEEFLEIYEFGVMPNVRDWQFAIFRQTGKYLAIQDLFEWIYEAE
jgi:hypothetical protein